jgi:hypothetical protein
MEETYRNMGLDGFIWWIGIVENRADPLSIGRCQVRIHNWHTDDKNLIPTTDLPWAQPLMPVNGTAPMSLKEGDTVMGFFLDGSDGQFPIIMGFLNGIPGAAMPNVKGFTDPRTPTQLINAPRKPESVTYTDNGQGVTVTEFSAAERNPYIIDESTLSRLTTGQNTNNTFVQTRKDNRIQDVSTSVEDQKWSEPETKYGAVYPYNKAIETESGHIFELDDTPGKERIQLAHRTGSFVEYYPDGSKVTKVVKNNYQIVMADDNVLIMGVCNVTINGKARLYIKSDYDMKVDGNMNVTVKGNMTTEVTGTTSHTSDGNYSVVAPRIDLNE